MKQTDFLQRILACLMVAVAVMLSTAAMAQTDVFQFEGAVLYTQTKDDDNKFQGYGVAAGYFFTPVSLTSLPWAEAAFLARASNVNIAAIRTDFDWDSATFGKISGDGYMVTGNIEIFVPGLPVYFSADVTRMKSSFESSMFKMDSVNTEFSGRIGVLPMQGILIGALYGRSLEAREGTILVTMKIDQDDTIDSFGGFLKIVRPIGDGMAFGIDLTAQRINTLTKDNTGGEADIEISNTNVEGMLAFYPMAQLGIGATFEIQRGDDMESEGNTYGITAIFFPIPNVGIQFSYSRFIPASDVDEDGNEILESDSFDISVRARF